MQDGVGSMTRSYWPEGMIHVSAAATAIRQNKIVYAVGNANLARFGGVVLSTFELTE